MRDTALLRVVELIGRKLPASGALPFLICAIAAIPTRASAQDSETRYVAPTNATVTTEIQEGYGSTPSQTIWIRNTSTVPIHVYSVTLRNCENIREDCSPFPLSLHVGPGDRAMLRRVNPHDPGRGFSFRYTFGWQADSSAMEALHLLANNGVAQARNLIAAQDAARSEENALVGVHDTDLRSADIVGLGAQIVTLRVDPDSVVLHPGQALVLHRVRVLAIDSQGAILGRVRAYQFRVPGGVLATHVDTVMAQRTGRSAVEYRLAPPAAPLSVSLPIIVTPADSVR
jgi:hypothetical protein